jgi:hypothetical protein
MDIAVFVGFAASGPLHTPVPIEDEASFIDIFGQDAPLAWDAERSEPINAYLSPAVRGFFRNGGRRCWVVRVAGAKAQANRFPVFGLVRATLGQHGEVDSIKPAWTEARSEGRWSDDLQVSAALDSRPIEVSRFWSDEGKAELLLRSRDSLGTGDLLRFQSHDHGIVVLFPIEQIHEAVSIEMTSPLEPEIPGTRLVHVFSRSTLWLKAAWAENRPGDHASVCIRESFVARSKCDARVVAWPSLRSHPSVPCWK